jgi:hypothetical protein
MRNKQNRLEQLFIDMMDQARRETVEGRQDAG